MHVIKVGMTMQTRKEVLTESDAMLWRYIKTERFLSLLRERKLRFSRLDTLGDVHEAAISRPSLERNMAELSERLSAERWLGTLQGRKGRLLHAESAPLALMRRQIYVSCWHRSDHESALMWSQYGSGVAIVSTIGRLDAAFPYPPDGVPIHVHPVQYIDPEVDDLDYLESYVHKLRVYRDEREVRAWLRLPDAVLRLLPNKLHTPEFWMIDCNLSTLISMVYLAPYSTQFREVRVALNAAGLTTTAVHDSAISTVPEYRRDLEKYISRRLITGDLE